MSRASWTIALRAPLAIALRCTASRSPVAPRSPVHVTTSKPSVSRSHATATLVSRPPGPLHSSARRGRGGWRVSVRAIAGDLHEPELDDVARDRRLCGGEARATERADDVRLCREPLLRNDTEERLLPVVLARERVPHAAASKTVPTCSPASSRSTASRPRVATIAARHPAAAA